MCIFDAEQAFVLSELEEEDFLNLLQGYGDISGKVVRLNRGVYAVSVKKSRTSNPLLFVGMKSPSFVLCLADTCVVRLIEDGAVSTIAV